MSAAVSFLFDGHGDEETVSRVAAALDVEAPELEPLVEPFWHSLKVTFTVPLAVEDDLPKGTWWTTMYVATEPIDQAFDVLHRVMAELELEPRHVTQISVEMKGAQALLAPVIELRRPA